MTETPDHKFAYHPPHLMIAVPDAKSWRDCPSVERRADVMWANTPYAHIMVPTAAPTANMTSTGR
jgi:hypothetical protein